MMVQVLLPHDRFNAAVKDGTIGSKIGRILEDIKPDAVYFSEQNGKRSATLIVDVADGTRVPAIAEPWFLTFNADVQFHVLMSPEELGRSSLGDLGKKWG
jgi:hypothetical protein